MHQITTRETRRFLFAECGCGWRYSTIRRAVERFHRKLLGHRGQTAPALGGEPAA